MAKKYRFLTSCVDADARDISFMVDQAQEVDIDTARNKCSTAIIEQHLGYGPEFPMSGDPEVGYFMSFYRGSACYYIVHSRIEYVFVRQ